MTEKELSLLRSISAEMDLLPGHTGFYYKNLTTGAAFSNSLCTFSICKRPPRVKFPWPKSLP